VRPADVSSDDLDVNELNTIQVEAEVHLEPRVPCITARRVRGRGRGRGRDRLIQSAEGSSRATCGLQVPVGNRKRIVHFKDNTQSTGINDREIHNVEQMNRFLDQCDINQNTNIVQPLSTILDVDKDIAAVVAAGHYHGRPIEVRPDGTIVTMEMQT